MSLQGLWKVHGDGKHIPPTEVVAPDERLAWPQTIGLGFQHVLAMFGATFIVPVLIGFPPNTTIFFSGIGTLMLPAHHDRPWPTPRPAELPGQQLRVHLPGARRQGESAAYPPPWPAYSSPARSFSSSARS